MFRMSKITIGSTEDSSAVASANSSAAQPSEPSMRCDIVGIRYNGKGNVSKMKLRLLQHVLSVAGLVLLASGYAAFRLHAAQTSHTASDTVTLQAGRSFTFRFPGLPPTFADRQKKPNQKQFQRKGGADTRDEAKKTDAVNDAAVPDPNHPPQMTVFLSKNYDTADTSRKYPVLIFLSGGDGGSAGDPSVARKLSEETDYVCVDLPLFKTDMGDYIVRENDSRYAWPFYKTMLAKLEEAVPNLHKEQYVLGGFSNGAHMTQGLIDTSNGEVAHRFHAFFLVEGGGHLAHWELLKGKPVLMLYGTGGGRPVERFRARSRQWHDEATAAGAKAAFHEMPDVGHAFPASAYPTVQSWLRLVRRGEPPIPETL